MGMMFELLKKIRFDVKYNVKKDKVFLRNKYIETFGSEPNFETPTTFNEKLLALSLYDRNLTKTVLADKYAVRKIIAMTIGEQYLIPLYQHTLIPEDVTKNSIPDMPVIVKTNHASGRVFIIKDKHNHDFASMYEDLHRRLNHNFYKNLREWQYKHIRPKVLVEQLLLTADGEIPEDYKFHCFNGEPKYIQVDSTRFSSHKRSIFDVDWNLLDIRYCFPKGGDCERPTTLEEMLILARKLSSQFNYCRVDLYSVRDKVYFGELTFSPGGGIEKFEPKSVDIEWGELIV